MKVSQLAEGGSRDLGWKLGCIAQEPLFQHSWLDLTILVWRGLQAGFRAPGTKIQGVWMQGSGQRVSHWGTAALISQHPVHILVLACLLIMNSRPRARTFIAHFTAYTKFRVHIGSKSWIMKVFISENISPGRQP